MAGTIRNSAGNGHNDRSKRPVGNASVNLTAPGLVRIDHYPAGPELQPYVTTLFTLRCDEPRIIDVLPAAVGFLAMVQSGTGTIRFVSGRSDTIHREMLLTPTSAAISLELNGPWMMTAAALSPLGWAALTGLNAAQHADRAYDAAAILGEDITAVGQTLCTLHSAAPGNDAALIAELAEYIQPRLKPLNTRHIALIATVTDWLSASFDPDLSDLQSAAPYSARQLERLVERYFGTGPKQQARKYRALRVAALLQADDTSDERAAELINLFFDQSHLIREMRHFLGRTPARLGKDADTLLSSAIALRNYREFKPNVARIPGD